MRLLAWYLRMTNAKIRQPKILRRTASKQATIFFGSACTLVPMIQPLDTAISARAIASHPRYLTIRFMAWHARRGNIHAVFSPIN